MLHRHPPQLVRCALAAVLAGALAQGAAAQLQRRAQSDPPGQSVVARPDGWFSGDSHLHVQLCAPTQPRDLPLGEIMSKMLDEQLHVASVLIWGAGAWTTEPDYLANYDPLVTGQEVALPPALGQDDFALQFGVENSGFLPDSLGHTIALNVPPALSSYLDLLGCAASPCALACDGGMMDTLYAGHVLDLWRQSPQTVTGYAHQMWPVTNTHPVYGIDWASLLPPQYGNDAKCLIGEQILIATADFVSRPALASVDVALGRVDFLETLDLQLDDSPSLPPGSTPHPGVRWYGMYYKLLNAGMRVSVTGGSDNTCYTPGSGRSARAWAYTGKDVVDFVDWVEAVRAGRVSLAMGPDRFLDLRVNGAAMPGDEVALEGVYQVGVTATLSTAPTVQTGNDWIEIVVNGDVVARSRPIDFSTPGPHVFETRVPMPNSGWIVARTGSMRLEETQTHTGAVYVIVDGRPIAVCRDAEYLTLYLDYFQSVLDLAATVPIATLTDVETCIGDLVRADIVQARRVFAAVRDYAFGLANYTSGVARYGRSKPSCKGPVTIGIRETAIAGSTTRITCFNAPPNAPGFLVLGAAQAPAGLTVLGADVLVMPGPLSVVVPVASDRGGYAESVIPTQPTASGATLFAQYVWAGTPSCPNPSGAVLCSSDALSIQFQ